MELKPERGSAGEAQHHGLAARGGETLLHRLTHQLGAVAVGEYQPRLVRNDLAWEVGGYGEIEPVAEGRDSPAICRQSDSRAGRT